MIDVKKPLRKAYYQLLNGHLVYNGNPVPVSETVEKLAQNASEYVLLKVQSGFAENTQNSWHNQEIMQLDIISRGTRVSKDTVDYIASQILMLLFPSHQGNALPVQPGVTFQNMYVTLDKDFEFSTTGGVNVARRVIEVTHFVSQ